VAEIEKPKSPAELRKNPDVGSAVKFMEGVELLPLAKLALPMNISGRSPKEYLGKHEKPSAATGVVYVLM
jgi:hypothetical protein